MSSEDDRIAYLASDVGGTDAAASTGLSADEQAELDSLRDLLADPSVWGAPDPSLEDRVVAAVTAEAARARAEAGAEAEADMGASEPGTAPFTAPIGGRRRAARPRTAPRRRLVIVSSALAAAAAVVVAIAVSASIVDRGATPPQLTAALSAPAPRPGGPGSPTAARPPSASATFTKTSAGWRVVLHTQRLPRLDHGRFYEAWMKNDAGVLVAIGTFNQGPTVTLWSGVPPSEFGTITVTAQEANGNPASSGQRVLVGTVKR